MDVDNIMNRKMNKAQLGYYILMIMSAIDGKYECIEGKVIVDFILKSDNELELDIDKENEILLSIDSDYFYNIKKLLEKFRDTRSIENPEDILFDLYKMASLYEPMKQEHKEVLKEACRIFAFEYEALLTNNFIEDLIN